MLICVARCVLLQASLPFAAASLNYARTRPGVEELVTLLHNLHALLTEVGSTIFSGAAAAAAADGPAGSTGSMVGGVDPCEVLAEQQSDIQRRVEKLEALLAKAKEQGT